MNVDELYTRCPTCKTVFRTHEEQLSVHAGRVRCGQCRMVFDGRAHLTDLHAQPDGTGDEREMGPPTVTSRTAVDPAPRPQSPPAAASGTSTPGGPAAGAQPALAAPAGTTPVSPAPAPVAPEPPAIEKIPFQREAAPPREEDPVMPVWDDTPPPPPRGVRWAYGVLAVLLLIALGGQATFYFRHYLAADYPRLRPHLMAACAALGCTIDPLRNKDEITIESHDLQADPAHQGLLILQTTLRNQARHPLAFPHLELELDDQGGLPLVRRVFAPAEYAGGAADFARGIPANAEWNVKIFLDASSVSAGGYNIYLFYP
jgi:predicted Zn finger-like uncharacterized protein